MLVARVQDGDCSRSSISERRRDWAIHGVQPHARRLSGVKSNNRTRSIEQGHQALQEGPIVEESGKQKKLKRGSPWLPSSRTS